MSGAGAESGPSKPSNDEAEVVDEAYEAGSEAGGVTYTPLATLSKKLNQEINVKVKILTASGKQDKKFDWMVLDSNGVDKTIMLIWKDLLRAQAFFDHFEVIFMVYFPVSQIS